MSAEKDIPLDIVNTAIDWNKPVELQNGLSLTVKEKTKQRIHLDGDGFSVIVTRTTGLPVIDVFNWDLFPVRNLHQRKTSLNLPI